MIADLHQQQLLLQQLHYFSRICSGCTFNKNVNCDCLVQVAEQQNKKLWGIPRKLRLCDKIIR